MSKQLTLKQMAVTPTGKVTSAESPMHLGTYWGTQVSVTLQAQFSGDKAAWWLRFATLTDAQASELTQAGWRYVERRCGWWSYKSDKSDAFVGKVTGTHVGKPAKAQAQAQPPKAATPVKAKGKTPAPVTPAPEQTPTDKRTQWLTTLSDAALATLLSEISAEVTRRTRK